MSTKLIVSAIDTQNNVVNVNLKRFNYGVLVSEKNTSISYEELFEGFGPETSMEKALFYVYILDEQINSHLELEDFTFDLQYNDPCP